METSTHSRMRFYILVLGLWGVLGVTAAPAAPAPQFRVEPEYVHIRSSFQGTSLLVTAEIPKGAQAVVELLGPTVEDRLLRKGRRGFLWMSVGQVKIAGAPSLYLLMTTAGAGRSHEGAGARWGYQELKRGVEFSGSMPKGGTDALFNQFVELKESEGLYGISPESLKVSGTSGDRDRLSGVLRIPAKIAPGTYKCCLSVIDKGSVVEHKCLDLSVSMRGLPDMLSSLARQHGIMYGLSAVFIALVTGFVIGFVFKSKGGH